MEVGEDEYLQHREHRLLMPEVAPNERIRASLLRMARLHKMLQMQARDGVLTFGVHVAPLRASRNK